VQHAPDHRGHPHDLEGDEGVTRGRGVGLAHSHPHAAPFTDLAAQHPIHDIQPLLGQNGHAVHRQQQVAVSDASAGCRAVAEGEEHQVAALVALNLHADAPILAGQHFGLVLGDRRINEEGERIIERAQVAAYGRVFHLRMGRKLAQVILLQQVFHFFEQAELRGIAFLGGCGHAVAQHEPGEEGHSQQSAKQRTTRQSVCQPASEGSRMFHESRSLSK